MLVLVKDRKRGSGHTVEVVGAGIVSEVALLVRGLGVADGDGNVTDDLLVAIADDDGLEGLADLDGLGEADAGDAGLGAQGEEGSDGGGETHLKVVGLVLGKGWLVLSGSD